MSAVSESGLPVPSVRRLKEELWRLAFPGTTEVDDESTLADLFEVAVARAKNNTRELLFSLLKVDAVKSPDRYSKWFSLPWFRHYTLNVDDLDEAINAHYTLPRPLQPVAGNLEAFVTRPGLLSIHLNGRIRDFPELTFSVRQYAERSSQPDGWYQTLVADLINHPVLFIGTALDEPGLWQHIELRRRRSATEIEMRPPSYLVSPQLPAARVALLKSYNIDWIQATEEQFFAELLEGLVAESDMGHGVLRQKYQGRSAGAAFHRLGDLREAPAVEDLGLFLLGREPVWADLLKGHAVERSFDRKLLDEVLDKAPSTVVLTGTAAVGKSTSGMRLVLALEALGKRTHVYSPMDGGTNIRVLLDLVEAHESDVLFIDDLDVFGRQAGRLLVELAELSRPPITVTAIRSSRLQSLDLAEELKSIELLEKTVPNLNDSDIDLLINALAAANRLGRLAGMKSDDRRKVFREQAGRQLLVAMYYATSGERLQDKVHSECSDLQGDARLAYGMAALATMERAWLTKDELVIGIGSTGSISPGNQRLNVIRTLVSRDLLLPEHKGLHLRHRWIAETVVEFFIDNGLIGNTLKALAFTMAVKSDPQMSWSSRERRLLRRLINHDYLQGKTGDVDLTREIYSSLEDELAWDYHYWLQRGSLEVEVGDLALAENFLNSAKSLAPSNDHLVRTEYSYLMLKKASSHPRSPNSTKVAEAALEDLEESIKARGSRDPYVFHVFGSQGLSWARRAPISKDQKRELVGRLLETVERGVKIHPNQRDLLRLRDDLKREHLMFAVPGSE